MYGVVIRSTTVDKEALVSIQQQQSIVVKQKKNLDDAVDISNIFLLCEKHLRVQISFYIFVIANLESDGTRKKINKKIFLRKEKSRKSYR